MKKLQSISPFLCLKSHSICFLLPGLSSTYYFLFHNNNYERNRVSIGSDPSCVYRDKRCRSYYLHNISIKYNPVEYIYDLFDNKLHNYADCTFPKHERPIL